jgi:hypothetical protein
MIGAWSRIAATLWPTDFGPDWSPEIPEPGDHEAARRDREAAAIVEAQPWARPALYPVVDVEAQAAGAVYADGRNKRRAYKAVDLSKRRVVVGLHQAGVERGEARWAKTVHRVTCHRAVGPTGTRYRVHPLATRLVCTNRFDRSPWHCLGIEQLGNMEGDEGRGNWYRPEVFGRGTFSDAECEALRQEVVGLCIEVEDLGAKVEGVVWHRVAGRNKAGPNRPICPGSAIVSQVAVWAACELGLRIPAPAQTWGGLPTPLSWYGERFAEAERLGLVGLR